VRKLSRVSERQLVEELRAHFISFDETLVLIAIVCERDSECALFERAVEGIYL